MFRRIDHVEIVPSDAERSIRFYTDVLGFQAKERMKVNVGPLSEIVYLQLQDTMLEIISAKSPAPLSKQLCQVGYRAMAIEVDSMDEAVTYLKNKGVAITWGPMDLGASKRAEIKDPDGISIELREWKK